MVQLEAHRAAFAEIGVNVAGMTYDAQSILADFHQQENLGYPLLVDEQAKHIGALGILNEDYPEGHQAYGIPHPGILYIGADGIIKAKFAVPGYRQRPPFKALLEYIRAMSG